MNTKEFFPDGTPIDDWFYDLSVPTLSEMGEQYVITDYGAKDDGALYTAEIQNAIDTAFKNGGGVVVVPKGTYMTGALHFKQGVNLYIEKDGVLKGSDDISDYDLTETRIEGQTCMYFGALINADGLDGFMIGGEGTIDGNGLRSWKAAWLRWTWNDHGSNKDEQRARLVYISNCKNVIISGVTLQNSQFWTTHLYRCDHVKYIGCRILSPYEPVKAPCTDAIDIDVCTDVPVKNCYMAVNDDAVVLKGGKGPYADTAPENGSNERVIVEDCEYGFCHGCLTFGSESVHNRNIIVCRIKVSENGYNLLWLKMRPDTPQHYEYITVEDITGNRQHFLNITPWTQYFDLGDRPDRPLSYADHITMRNCRCDCDIYFDVKPDREQYLLSDFTLENLDITAKKNGYTDGSIDNIKINNVSIKSL
ncbi:MAG: exopolygalacturonase [Clostridia bacterium]|nr:exopolygalacturonase [Clostridia bacterium]